MRKPATLVGELEFCRFRLATVTGNERLNLAKLGLKTLRVILNTAFKENNEGESRGKINDEEEKFANHSVV